MAVPLRLPTEDKLKHIKLVLEVLLLLVAVPLVLWGLFTHPTSVRDKAIGRVGL